MRTLADNGSRWIFECCCTVELMASYTIKAKLFGWNVLCLQRPETINVKIAYKQNLKFNLLFRLYIS